MLVHQMNIAIFTSCNIHDNCHKYSRLFLHCQKCYTVTDAFSCRHAFKYDCLQSMMFFSLPSYFYKMGKHDKDRQPRPFVSEQDKAFSFLSASKNVPVTWSKINSSNSCFNY